MYAAGCGCILLGLELVDTRWLVIELGHFPIEVTNYILMRYSIIVQLMHQVLYN